ncbi:MAG: C-terminal binding protein [Dehalococcoidia bacterium]
MAFKVVQVIDKPGSYMPDYGEMIRQAGIEVEFLKVDCSTEDEIIDAAADADVVVGVATFQPLTRRVIDNLEKCRFIMSLGIGYDNLDVKAATERGVFTANVPDYCQEEMSDHAMALILVCTRKIVRLNDIVKAGQWKQEPDPDIQMGVWPSMARLSGQTLGLVGLGRIARTLVPKAKAFGLRIIAYSPHVDRKIFDEFNVERVELDQLLAQSDIISLHTALTPQNKHLLGAEQFNKTKPGAYLINTARGGLVDQEALYQALVSGKLAGAALDVTDPEPINADDPLLNLENVVITAHSAHASIPSLMALLNRPAEEVIRVLRGEEPVGLINPEAKGKYIQRWGPGNHSDNG